MDAGYEITLADVNAALEKQGMKDFKFMPGDGVFFRTGWGKHWIKDNAKFNGGEPGIGMEVAKWLSDVVQAGVVGADTWATEVIPNKEPGCAFCIHRTCSRATASSTRRTWTWTAWRPTRCTASCTCTARCRSPVPPAPRRALGHPLSLR